jgi:hypothetical protein
MMRLIPGKGKGKGKEKHHKTGSLCTLNLMLFLIKFCINNTQFKRSKFKISVESGGESNG